MDIFYLVHHCKNMNCMIDINHGRRSSCGRRHRTFAIGWNLCILWSCHPIGVHKLQTHDAIDHYNNLERFVLTIVPTKGGACIVRTNRPNRRSNDGTSSATRSALGAVYKLKEGRDQNETAAKTSRGRIPLGRRTRFSLEAVVHALSIGWIDLCTTILGTVHVNGYILRPRFNQLHVVKLVLLHKVKTARCSHRYGSNGAIGCSRVQNTLCFI